MDELLTLLEYTAWATERMLSALTPLTPEELARDLHSSHGGVAGTLAHLYGSDVIWTARLCAQPPISYADLPELPSLNLLQAQWLALQTGRRGFVSGLEPEQRIAYANLRGDPQLSTVGEMVRHMVNHATYHRGQMVTMLRQLGHTAPNTDLIAFYRLQHSGSKRATAGAARLDRSRSPRRKGCFHSFWIGTPFVATGLAICKSSDNHDYEQCRNEAYQ